MSARATRSASEPRPVRRRLFAAMLIALAAVPAGAGDVSHGTRRRLRELQKLCEEGLVAPAICLEKQRALLGLQSGSTAGTVASAGGAAPAPNREGRAEPPVASRAATDAVTHDSPFGFRVELPTGWSVVPPEALDAGFDVLRDRLAADPAAVALVDQLRRDGAHRRGEIYAVARDRLQVLPSPSRLPENAAARMRICTQFGAATSKAVGRRVSTQTCSPRTVAGRPALLIERDALLPGSRTVQYWISTPDGRALSFVTTCRVEDADVRRRELERVVDSLRWS